LTISFIEAVYEETNKILALSLNLWDQGY